MGVWQNLDRRRGFVQWHSRSMDRQWIVNEAERTYRDAQGLPAPGEEIVRASENDLWALAYRDVPRRDVPQKIYL